MMDKKQSTCENIERVAEDTIRLANRCGSFSRRSTWSRDTGLRQSSSSLRKQTTTRDSGRSISKTNSVAQVFNETVETETPKRRHLNSSFHHYRFLVVIFGGLSVGTVFFLRYNVTISVLKMVNQTAIYLEEHPGKTVDDMLDEGIPTGGEFNWNNEIQQMIMSWYMFSYTLPQMPMTKVASFVGCRWAVFLSLVVCAVSTLLTPLFAYLGWQYVIFLRMVNGLGASAILPMLLTLLEAWLTYDEISIGLSISQTLSTLCLAANPLIAGYLGDIHWSLTFYVPGSAAIVFAILWLVCITDNPNTNTFISECELKHICGSEETPSSATKSECDKNTDNDEDQNDHHPKSWLAVFQVPSFYAFMLVWTLHNCSFNGFNFVLPTYLIQILKIKVTENGLFCSIIQTGCIIAVIWPHPVLRLLRNKCGLSEIASRRIAMTVCCSVLAVTWSLVGLYHQNQLALLFVNRCMQNGVDVLVTSTLMLNYARAGLSSLAYSAINTVGNLVVVFTSTFIGWLLDYTGRSRTGWGLIFAGFAISQVLAWLLFCTSISADPIEFDKSKNKSKKQEYSI